MVKDLGNGKVLDLDIETLQDYSNEKYLNPIVTGSTVTTGPNGETDARDFDGNDDEISFGGVGLSGGDSRTISGWVYGDSTTQNHWADVFGFKGASTAHHYFDIETNTNNQYVIHVYSQQYTIHSVVANQWHHIVGTYDGSRLRAYWDGSKVVDVSYSSLAADDTVYISGRNHYHGRVSQFKIWNYKLSDSEVSNLYNNGTVPSNGLLLDFNMATFKDNTPINIVAHGTTLTTDSDGRYNQARSFNNTTSDYVDLPYGTSITSSSKGTIRIKFYLSALGTTGFLYSIGRDEYSGDISGEIRLGIWHDTSNKLNINLRDSGLNTSYPFYSWFLQSDATLTDNTCYDLFLVFDTSPVAYLYNNNNLITTFSFTDSTDTSDWINDITTINYSTLGMAKYTAGGGASLNGYISKFVMWNRALSAEEVYQDYLGVSHNYQGLFDGLVAGYDFKGDAKDFSGNGYDGVVSGASLTTDQFGIVDSAYSFDGINHNKITITPGNILGTNQAQSVSIYVKVNSLANLNYVVNKIYNNYYPVPFDFKIPTDGSIQVTYGDGGNSTVETIQSSSGFVTAGNYYFITFSYNPVDDKVYLYVNKDLNINQNAGVNLVDKGTNIEIGTRNNDSNRLFNGIVYFLIIKNKYMDYETHKSLYDLINKSKLYPYSKNNRGITE